MDSIKGWDTQFRDYLTIGPGKSEIFRLLQEPDDQVYHSLVLHCCQLFDTEQISEALVFSAILLDPESAFKRCDEILVESNVQVYKEINDPVLRSRCKVKSKLRFRISDLPSCCPEYVRCTVPRSADVGLLLSITGTVIKTILPKMLNCAQNFVCSKCRFRFLVQGDYEQRFKLEKPPKCPNPISCDGFKFNPVTEEVNVELCRDYQEIKIQEQVGKLNLGTIPRSIWVTLEDDLINVCKPGDDVTVNGIVKRRWQPLGRGSDGRTDLELVIKAVYVTVNNDQQSKNLLTPEQIADFKQFWKTNAHNPLEGRNEILASFCPQIYGLFTIKLALAVVLCGGVERVDDSGTKVRGDAHMFLLGDPGTGKSQLLRYASKLSPRSVLTTGIGSTNAGLTVSAVRDGGEWQLEAGALVLADGGVCCIDEFNTIREADRTCIHEAMEQQSLSVAKAGLVCKLQTRCSVLAAANPKGQYDSSKPLTVNAAIASPLLSRFDIVFVLLDSRNKEWDELVSSNILKGKKLPFENCEIEDKLLSLEKLQAYFAYCKRLNPEMSPEASTILSKFYQKQRRDCDGSNMARVTVRLLQSAIRLAQGHARFMCHEVVSVIDAVYSVLLLNSSAESTLNCYVNPLHSAFPKNALDEYCSIAEKILKSLDLTEIWEREVEKIQNLSSVHQVSAVTSDKTQILEKDIPTNDMVMTQVLSKLKSRQLNYEEMTNNLVKLPKEQTKKKRKLKKEQQIENNSESSDDEDVFEIFKAKKQKCHRKKKNPLDSDSDVEEESKFRENLVTSTQAGDIVKDPSGQKRDKINDTEVLTVQVGQNICDSSDRKIENKVENNSKGTEKSTDKISETTLSVLKSFQAPPSKEKPMKETEPVKNSQFLTPLFENPDEDIIEF